LKEALCTEPVLGYPRPGEKFIVDTDASNTGIGGVLSQVQDGHEQVVAYFSSNQYVRETGWEGTDETEMARDKTGWRV
jgi:hypothetical protein